MRIKDGRIIAIDPRDRVTRHFTAAEFSTNADPYPLAHVDRMLRLAMILERCREFSHRPLRITSGWRSPSANERAGGAAKSQHCHGRAVDFRDYRGDNEVTRRIYEFLEKNVDELGIGGLGWYPVPRPADSPLKDAGRTFARIHVDIRPRLAGQAVARWTH